jgi:lysine 6-dehydrogenase
VGGLPQVRTWPYAYKAVFSTRDVIEEYVRPARYVEHGVDVVRPALSDVELLDFPGVGTLEAFNTDGLRTLRHTLDAPFMIEKTLRYPGHAELMRTFRESGFFSPEPITAGGQEVSPLEVTSALLFDRWRLEPGETDLTVLQVQVEGTEAGRRVRHTFDLLDRFDLATGTTSMARTTGYTCAIVARLVADGRFARPGICPPELVGADQACYDFVMAECDARGIDVRETVTML